MSVDTILVAALVGGALGYLAVRWWQGRKPKKPGCGPGCGCG